MVAHTPMVAGCMRVVVTSGGVEGGANQSWQGRIACKTVRVN